ncbi:MAG: hypothetical protein NZ578_02925 [Candidatus Binatia bacterium]|nr:hypothetical protein [Candidatus Binatia bacterium]
MQNFRQHIAYIYVALSLGLISAAPVSAHEGGGSSGKNLVELPLRPNPNIPEFANASGTVRVNLAQGIIQLKNVKGFPLDPQRKTPLVTNITALTDPRLKDSSGHRRQTSCHLIDEHASTATEERAHEGDHGDHGDHEAGPWTCHVHSYVVWLVSLHDGVLGHSVISLGTIYPRRDGTVADREFSAREGDLSGLFSTAVIITAEPTFGPLPSITTGHDGQTAIDLVPRGPIVLQATLP